MTRSGTATATHRPATDSESASASRPAERRASMPLTAGGLRRAHTGLKWTLIALDSAILAAWWVTAGLGLAGATDARPGIGSVFLFLPASLCSLAAHDLYRSRTCEPASVETLAVGRSTCWVVAGTGAWYASVGHSVPLVQTLMAGMILSVGLISGRAMFRRWLSVARSRGRYTRALVLIRGSGQATATSDLLTSAPSSGYRIVGAVGVAPDPGEQLEHLGGIDAVPTLIREGTASGGLVDTASLSGAELTSVLTQLSRAGAHAHIAGPLASVASTRVRSRPFGRTPHLHVAPTNDRAIQRSAKRALDLVLAAVLFTFAVPVLVVAGLAVRLEDGGPVLFRQVRVGRDERPFRLLKLRTMTVGAESQRASLRDRNRRQGPLFKVDDDPRVTRVGRVLRATSLDELPQLVNVLKGEMSLVGPRPALPSEVVQFDDELRARSRVRPGISGLWQVEARDDESFDAYRRLDLYYIDNRSLGLDLSIILHTVPAVVTRSWRALRPTEKSTGGSATTTQPAH